MLRVVYEATTDIAPGRLVQIQETRGRVSVKLRQGVTADEYIPQLNAALKDFVSQCSWFQIWRGKIISANSPDSPLTVQYEADSNVDRKQAVQIREHRGVVRLHICPDLTSEELALAVNKPIELFLAGGQWFQLWQGEIVTMEEPGSTAA
ncbi:MULTISPECIES: hypothetical protein [Streptomyces]|uniref:Uncharacterized protein n=1 Tax=Streptomyces tricolor TaxID=68277 RepID=A0ABS9JET2_9ACTN|nr:hypothetical protein [Streptomyces tricolor]MCG0064055.1 hypothetical protein [Streptomyces tricolor]MYU30635.1 hypothetical protein [Streptomyces sp. SID7810]CUW31708.1 hypothetical protein TUE45_06457 [Streptomyces reticuli]